MSEATIFSRLLEETERVTQIGAREILGNSRLKPIVVARKIFWCALRMAGFSTPRDRGQSAPQPYDGSDQNKTLAG